MLKHTPLILISDDDDDDIALLHEALLLVYPNANVEITRDGVASLRYLKTGERPDMMFLDLNMPIKGGLQTLKDMGKDELHDSIAVIIYSTSHNIRDIDSSYKYGAALYLVKPTSFKSLLRLLQQVEWKLQTSGSAQSNKEQFVVREDKGNSSND